MDKKYLHIEKKELRAVADEILEKFSFAIYKKDVFVMRKDGSLKKITSSDDTIKFLKKHPTKLVNKHKGLLSGFFVTDWNYIYDIIIDRITRYPKKDIVFSDDLPDFHTERGLFKIAAKYHTESPGLPYFSVEYVMDFDDKDNLPKCPTFNFGDIKKAITKVPFKLRENINFHEMLINSMTNNDSTTRRRLNQLLITCWSCWPCSTYKKIFWIHDENVDSSFFKDWLVKMIGKDAIEILTDKELTNSNISPKVASKLAIFSDINYISKNPNISNITRYATENILYFKNNNTMNSEILNRATLVLFSSGKEISSSLKSLHENMHDYVITINVNTSNINVFQMENYLKILSDDDLCNWQFRMSLNDNPHLSKEPETIDGMLYYVNDPYNFWFDCNDQRIEEDLNDDSINLNTLDYRQKNNIKETKNDIDKDLVQRQMDLDDFNLESRKEIAKSDETNTPVKKRIIDDDQMQVVKSFAEKKLERTSGYTIPSAALHEKYVDYYNSIGRDPKKALGKTVLQDYMREIKYRCESIGKQKISYIDLQFK